MLESKDSGESPSIQGNLRLVRYSPKNQCHDKDLREKSHQDLKKRGWESTGEGSDAAWGPVNTVFVFSFLKLKEEINIVLLLKQQILLKREM